MDPQQPASAGLPRRDFLKASVITAGTFGAAGWSEGGLRNRVEREPEQPPVGRSAGTYNTRYSGARLNRIAFPMGGLGAGMICLEGTGALSHLSLRHKPDVYNEPQVFAAICVKGTGNVARMLEGPVPRWKAFGSGGTSNGAIGKTYGLPRFAIATFRTRFPAGIVALEDPDVPVAVEITGWSPFIPGDPDNSSLPVAALEYRLTSRSDRPVEAVFSFNARNFMATGKGQSVLPATGGFLLNQAGSKEKPWEQGAFCASVDEVTRKVNHAWFRGFKYDALTMVWSDVQSGAAYDRPPIGTADPAPGATLYVPFTLGPGAEKRITLRLCWYVPQSDLRASRGTPQSLPEGKPLPPHKPWYATRFKDIHEVAAYWRENYARLREASEAFTKAFYSQTFPPEVIEAVAANLTILKSPTVLRQADGRLWGWEGCFDGGGCCPGSCTHVWNYAQAVPHLFPSLERTLRETEFGPDQNAAGHQAFRATLPIWYPPHDFHAAADGQLGGIMKAYREWRISGDSGWLGKMWPRIRLSLDYCIATWDPDRKGILEEPHHNTYDVEFWGPDGMCTSFYLEALNAAIRMGTVVGEDVSGYRELLSRGKRYMESELWDGEYFFQKVQWQGLKAGSPLEVKSFHNGYSPEAMELLKTEGPKYQYGQGCLSDGVIGSWLAEMCGLASCLDRGKVASHLKAVHKHNLRRDLSKHANPQRPAYAMGGEGGLLLCSWPKGGQPSLPFIYSNEVWTGIEYQVASHLMSHGFVTEGLEIVRTCRDRYDGTVRNPFNEYECGHWYARAMSSYGLIQSLSGVRYDAVDRVLTVHPRVKGDFRSFLSTETGYGIVGVKDGAPFVEVTSGRIDYARLDYEAA
jgi:uncharacterized protein (DUF608 family)